MDGLGTMMTADSVARGALMRVLQGSAVFRTLSEEELVGLTTQAERIAVDRKHKVGLLGDGFVYVIGRGRARIKRRCGDRDLTLEYVGPGDMFGEQGLWDPHPEGEVVGLDSVEVVRLPLASVKKLVNSHPAFSAAMLMATGNRRRVAEHRIHAMLSRDVESRVAEFILDVASKHGIPDQRGILVEFKFTHQEIADYVGSTRETVTLVMGAFKRSGVVLPDHRRALIKDVEALRRRI